MIVRAQFCYNALAAVAEILVQQGIDEGKLTEEMREEAMTALMESAADGVEVDLG